MKASTPYSFLARARWAASPWLWGFVLLVVLVCLPLGALMAGLRLPSLTAIPGILISDYALNSYVLVLGVGGISLLFGVPTAWLTSTANFPGRKALEWLLVLPLALPAYIAAYTYKGIFNPYGTLQGWFGFYIKVDNLPMLCLIMGSVLYPYVYLVSRSVFLKHAQGLEDAARSLGYSTRQTFFKLVLPLSRPAIVGGLSLVVMETLNNYGAVQYFGIKTFTTELIRQWDPTDLQPVVGLSAALLLVVFLLFQGERWQRRRSRHFERSGTTARKRLQLTGGAAWGAVGLCLLPLLIGFIIPVAQLLVWAVPKLDVVVESDFLSAIGNTFYMAAMAAGACTLAALLTGFVQRLIPRPLVNLLSRLSTLGYAVPGAVIGIGILIPLTWLNRSFGWALTGTMGILIYAYVVRFQAVAFQSISAGFKKHSPNLLHAARSLGHSPGQALWKVELPLLRPALLASIILVFVDVTKELPLTMLFQRFNFETLAIRAFVLMETDGAVYDSAVPALIILLIGLVPVFLLNRLTTRS